VVVAGKCGASWMDASRLGAGDADPQCSSDHDPVPVGLRLGEWRITDPLSGEEGIEERALTASLCGGSAIWQVNRQRPGF
jgi:hypothetical protein